MDYIRRAAQHLRLCRLPSCDIKGMTLVEVLISLTILMIVLSAIFSILNMQQTKATNVQTTTVMQTDAQIALTLFRWDLFMAGYGIAYTEPSIVTDNNATAVSSDDITLYGAGLAFESKKANWSPILEGAPNSSEIIVYKFDDSLANFKVNDKIIIISQAKILLEENLTIDDIDTCTYSQGEDNEIDALRLTLSRTVSVGQGTIAFSPDSATYFNGVSYTLNNGHLMRGNEVFLDNVEDIQFAYGIDFDDNGTFEPGEWFNELDEIPAYTPAMLYQHRSVVRSSFVVLSDRALKDYEYGSDSILIEDHTHELTDTEKRYKREIVTAVSRPRNLQY